MSRLHAIALTALLLGVTAIWGWTFLIVKDAVATYPVVSFLALRFTFATILLAPFTVRGWTWKTVATGGFIGVTLALGYLFQTLGLTSTSAAHAGLLTGLFVIFTPILNRLLYATRLASITVASATVGIVGTGLLTLTGGTANVSWGDGLEILTAITVALQIVWLGRYSGVHPTMQLAAAQMAPAAVGFWFIALVIHPHFRFPSTTVWIAILITGGLASALAFWVQTFVQQRITSARAAVIMLGEPLFATVFAVWLGGEQLSLIQWFGAVLILTSLVAHEAWIAYPRTAPVPAS